IDFVGLSRFASAPVAALPFGTQKRVELARALVSKPRLLLLDEPAGGISHEEVSGVAAMVQRIHRDLGVTVVLVEHNMAFVMGIAHVPEGRGVLTELTVEENLRLGAYLRRDGDGIAKDYDRVFGYFPILRERRKLSASTLSGGEQQMLALARALLMRPKLLLL